MVKIERLRWLLERVGQFIVHCRLIIALPEIASTEIGRAVLIVGEVKRPEQGVH
jgi:hypothetical protein